MIGNPTIFFDCDDTLVIWENSDGTSKNKNAVTFRFEGRDFKLVPHKKHIELLKRCKKDGYEVVVWSAGSRKWGEEVIKKLKLTKYVDFIISKPTFYVDDLPTKKILHEHKRLFLKIKSFLGI